MRIVRRAVERIDNPAPSRERIRRMIEDTGFFRQDPMVGITRTDFADDECFAFPVGDGYQVAASFIFNTLITGGIMLQDVPSCTGSSSANLRYSTFNLCASEGVEGFSREGIVKLYAARKAKDGNGPADYDKEATNWTKRSSSARRLNTGSLSNPSSSKPSSTARYRNDMV